LHGVPSARHRRAGLSLLEIILSIVILGGSIVVLGEMARSGLRSAQSARLLSQAQLLCETKMAELEAGILELEPVAEVPIDDVPDTNVVNPNTPGTVRWLYSIEIETLDDEGLLRVAVVVSQNLPPEQEPLACRLVRWRIDEEVVENLLAESEASSQEEDSASTQSLGELEGGGR
jgi:type II secretory pathway pseudopilin PulG